MTRHRYGFTFAELMTVLVIMVIVMAIGVPRFNYMQQGAHVRSARDQLSAYLATARAAAIQRGRDARFTLKVDTIAVERDQGGGVWVPVSPAIPLRTSFGVTVTSSVTQITYNSRGTAKALPSSGAKFVVTRDAKKDSVCITKFGMIMKARCL